MLNPALVPLLPFLQWNVPHPTNWFAFANRLSNRCNQSVSAIRWACPAPAEWRPPALPSFREAPVQYTPSQACHIFLLLSFPQFVSVPCPLHPVPRIDRT